MVNYAIFTENLSRIYKIYTLQNYYEPGLGGETLGGSFIYDLWKRLTARKNIIKALDGINIRIKEGEFVTLLGPNGSGKTTLLKILATLILPTNGKAEIMGYDVVKEKHEVLKRISYIPSLLAGSAWANVNVSLIRNLRNMARLFGFSQRDVEEVLDMLDLNHLKERPFGSLSTGQQARAVIALGILKKASVLLLDEPTMGLSLDAIEITREYFKKVNKELGVTILYATHHAIEAQKLSDRVIFLSNGKVLADGNPHDLIRHIGKDEIITIELYNVHTDLNEFIREFSSYPESAKIKCLDPIVGEYRVRFRVRDSRETLPDLIDKLMSEGIKLRNLKVLEPTLEDVFMHFVKKGRQNAAFQTIREH